jgi:hypothetical protein
MKLITKISILSTGALVPATLAEAHSGPGAVHNFDLLGALAHIVSSPDHVLLFLLAIGLGALAGSRALAAQKRKQREPDDDH